MKIDYQIKYSSKRKKVNISVERDRSVIIRAPLGVTKEKIEDIIKSKKDWIIEKINHKQKYPVDLAPKEFVSGETMMYLGRNYQLAVIDEDIDGVQFNQKFLISKSKQQEAYSLFKKWYCEKAKSKIEDKVNMYAKNLGVDVNKVRISDMKYRWGSCTPSNNVIFNWRIIKAPMYVVDYLIVHELAHLIESNHTSKFWNIVSIQVPQYLKSKEWLKKYGHLLEIDF